MPWKQEWGVPKRCWQPRLDHQPRRRWRRKSLTLMWKDGAMSDSQPDQSDQPVEPEQPIETPPGQSEDAPGQGGDAPGRSEDAPGQNKPEPDQGLPEEPAPEPAPE